MHKIEHAVTYRKKKSEVTGFWGSLIIVVDHSYLYNSYHNTVYNGAQSIKIMWRYCYWTVRACFSLVVLFILISITYIIGFFLYYFARESIRDVETHIIQKNQNCTILMTNLISSDLNRNQWKYVEYKKVVAMFLCTVHTMSLFSRNTWKQKLHEMLGPRKHI